MTTCYIITNVYPVSEGLNSVETSLLMVMRNHKSPVSEGLNSVETTNIYI